MVKNNAPTLMERKLVLSIDKRAYDFLVRFAAKKSEMSGFLIGPAETAEILLTDILKNIARDWADLIAEARDSHDGPAEQEGAGEGPVAEGPKPVEPGHRGRRIVLP